MAANDTQNKGIHRFSSSSMGDQIVTIKFCGQSCVVHQAVLTRHSPFFAKAFEGSFKEALESTIEVEAAHPEIVFYVIDWMYTRQLPTNTQMMEYCIDAEDHPHIPRRFSKNKLPGLALHLCIIDIFIFSDKYNIPLLRSTLMDNLHREFTSQLKRGQLELEEVWLIAKSLPESSPLFRFAVDLLIVRTHALSNRWVHEVMVEPEWADIGEGFWRAVAIRALRVPRLSNLPEIASYQDEPQLPSSSASQLWK